MPRQPKVRLTDIAVLRLNPGDAIVASFPAGEKPPNHKYSEIRKALRDALKRPDLPVIIKSDSVTLSVVQGHA